MEKQFNGTAHTKRFVPQPHRREKGKEKEWRRKRRERKRKRRKQASDIQEFLVPHWETAIDL